MILTPSGKATQLTLEHVPEFKRNREGPQSMLLKAKSKSCRSHSPMNSSCEVHWTFVACSGCCAHNEWVKSFRTRSQTQSPAFFSVSASKRPDHWTAIYKGFWKNQDGYCGTACKNCWQSSLTAGNFAERNAQGPAHDVCSFLRGNSFVTPLTLR